MARVARLILLFVALNLAACMEFSSQMPLPPEKMDYAGEWRGEGMTLEIAADGAVLYHRKQPHSEVRIEAGIKEFHGDDFSIGVGPASTTFKVSAPPHLDGGVWKMTVDGVELTRLPSTETV